MQWCHLIECRCSAIIVFSNSIARIVSCNEAAYRTARRSRVKHCIAITIDYPFVPWLLCSMKKYIWFALCNKCHWYELVGSLKRNVIIILFKSSSINIDETARRRDYRSRRRLQIFSREDRARYYFGGGRARTIVRSHLRLNMAYEYTPKCVGRSVLICAGLSRNKLRPVRATRRCRPATMTPAATMTQWDGRGASFN